MLAAIDSCEQAVNIHVFFVVDGTYGWAVERPIHTKPRFLRIALF